MGKIIGYWFTTSDELPNGDKRKVVIGEMLSVKGVIKLCRNGLHASREPFDALSYARGSLLYKVMSSGTTEENGDKYCSRNRTAIAVIDAAPICRQFARDQALSVAHLWDMPAVVKEYLETGDEKLRIAARAAADDAAYAARAAAANAAYAAADAAINAAAVINAARAAAAYAARAAAYAARAAATDAAARKRFNEMIEEAFSL